MLLKTENCKQATRKISPHCNILPNPSGGTADKLCHFFAIKLPQVRITFLNALSITCINTFNIRNILWRNMTSTVSKYIQTILTPERSNKLLLIEESLHELSLFTTLHLECRVQCSEAYNYILHQFICDYNNTNIGYRQFALKHHVSGNSFNCSIQNYRSYLS